MRTKQAALASLIVILSVGAGVADDFGKVGVELCAKPTIPGCMVTDQTFASRQTIESCNHDADQLAKDLATYRTCVLMESYRTVSQVNDLLARFRCRAYQKVHCQ